MSLTRKKLKAMGLTEEQVDEIIEEHGETVTALKDDITKYKADAQKLSAVQKELDDLKAERGDGWKEKYEKEHSDFEAYKTEQSAKETKAAKERAFRELIKAANISEKRAESVLKVSNVDEIEFDKDGKVKNGEELTKKIQTEFADFVVTTTEQGAHVATPPTGGAGNVTDLGTLDMESYIAARTKKG